MSRNLTLDLIKGCAIVLVILGHSIQENISNYWLMWYYHAIYALHMPLFMFISGYLAYGKLDFRWLSRRFLQLMTPYVSWHFILYYWSTFKFSGLQTFYPNEGGVLGSLLHMTIYATGLWFFLILFLLFCLLYLTRGNRFALFSITLLAVTIMVIIPEIPRLEPMLNGNLRAIGKVIWFMPFLASGYLASMYKEKIMKLESLKWILLVAFPILFWIIGNEKYTLSVYPTIIIYRYVIAFLGIGMVFSVIKLLPKVGIIQRFLCYLGLITIGIYPGHTMWLKLGVGDGIINVITATIVSLLLAVVIIQVFQRFKITDYLFLGKGKTVFKT